MSRFDHLTPKPNGIRITGAVLGCYKCSGQADEGVYWADTKTLTWICPNGHGNELKDFNIPAEDLRDDGEE